MRQISIDDDLISQLAMTFESVAKALRRAQPAKRRQRTADELLAELDAMGPDELARNGLERKGRLRAPSPKPRIWVAGVPELRAIPGLTSWRAISDHLGIAVGGDSARRRLRDWVKKNRPKWPPVPEA